MVCDDTAPCSRVEVDRRFRDALMMETALMQRRPTYMRLHCAIPECCHVHISSYEISGVSDCDEVDCIHVSESKHVHISSLYTCKNYRAAFSLSN
jgi:hypothetical protein